MARLRLDDPSLRVDLPDGELFFRELECLDAWAQAQMTGEREPVGLADG